MPGQIGRYQVLGRLGRGANGEVFICHDPVLDRPLALKALHSNLCGEQRAALLQRFWIEVRVRGRLSHPHLVDVYDAGIDGDRPFLVMELCNGPTLQGVLSQRGTLPLSQAMWVLRQVVDALDYIHEMGVIHRDVKPENLLFDGHILKLTDFGAAHLTSDEAQELEMIGTPEFMAPEQVTGVPVDHHTDLYAAGVLLFELLAGRPPFRGEAMDVLHRIALEDAPLFSSVAPGFPAALDAFFCRALHRSPEARFGSGSEMSEALRSIFPDVSPQPIRGLEALAELAQAHGQETVRFTGSELFLPDLDSDSGTAGWLAAPEASVDVAPWTPGMAVEVAEDPSHLAAFGGSVSSWNSESGLRSALLWASASWNRVMKWIPSHRGVARGMAAAGTVVGIAGCLVSSITDDLSPASGMEPDLPMLEAKMPLLSGGLTPVWSGGPVAGQGHRIAAASDSPAESWRPAAETLGASRGLSASPGISSTDSSRPISSDTVPETSSRAVVRHRQPQGALSGRPLVLDLELTQGLPGCRVVSSWRQGKRDWQQGVVRALDAHHYRVRVNPSSGPLDYRFQVLYSGGTLVAEAGYQIDVRAPEVTVSLNRSPLREAITACRQDPGACYGRSSPAATF